MLSNDNNKIIVVENLAFNVNLYMNKIELLLVLGGAERVSTF